MRKYETVLINDFMTKEIITTVREEDYLKVVEESDLYKENLKRVQSHLQIKVQECEEKDEFIENLKKLIEFAESINNISKYYGEEIKRELKEKDEEIERLKEEKQILKDKLDEWEYVEQTWTLKYVFENSETKEIKEYEQNGMIKEDAEELIGMDSDNWNHWSLTKEERPDKDKIIEGLIIRADSSEEIIKEFEEKIENLEIENRQLRNDHRLKIGLSDRRA